VGRYFLLKKISTFFCDGFLMTQDNPFFGLNMLPIFLEMIEAKLEIAENQLPS